MNQFLNGAGRGDESKYVREYYINNFVMCNIQIPTEIISMILINYVDFKSLVNCQAVSPIWRNLIQNYVWRRKSESIVGEQLSRTKVLPWILYYQICQKKSFDKNIIKNHSGDKGLLHWANFPSCKAQKTNWIVDDYYFTTTSNKLCTKFQIIDLVAQGLSPEFLDKYQPLIKFGEWYSCKKITNLYKCHIVLIADDDQQLDEFHFKRTVTSVQQDTWQQVYHEFTNYGPGLRKIYFEHSGRDEYGLRGSKITGTNLSINIEYEDLISILI